MGKHNPCNRVDRILVAYLLSQGAGTADDVFSGKNPDPKVIPCTICSAHSARKEVNPFTGRWIIEPYIEIRTNSVARRLDEDDEPVDPVQDSDDRVSAVYDLFEIGDGQSSEALCNAIKTAAPSGTGTILELQIVGVEQGFNSKTMTTQGPQPFNTWVDTLHLEGIWVPADVR
jgi:hypothetical protein